MRIVTDVFGKHDVYEFNEGAISTSKAAEHAIQELTRFLGNAVSAYVCDEALKRHINRFYNLADNPSQAKELLKKMHEPFKHRR